MNFTDKKFGSTLAVNYLAASIIAASPIICIPFYLKILGLENWSYIGYMLLTQGVLAILDGGLVLGFIRGFSEQLKLGKKNALVLLKTLENFFLYFLLILISGLLLIYLFFIPILLKVTNDLVLIYCVMGGIGIYALNSLCLPHKAFLTANKRQKQNNMLSAFGVSAKHSIAIYLMGLYPSIMCFLIVHLSITFLESIIRIYMAWWSQSEKPKSNYSVIKKYKSELFQISSATILGSVCLQVDKFIAAILLSKTSFAKYSIAATLGIGVIQIIYPILSTSLPNFLNASDNKEKLYKLNYRLFIFIFIIITVGWTVWSFIGKILTEIFLQSSSIATEIFPLITIFLVGSSIYFVNGIIHNNLLAYKLTNYILLGNLLTLLSLLTILPFLIISFGLYGACFGWCLATSITTTVNTYAFCKNIILKSS